MDFERSYLLQEQPGQTFDKTKTWLAAMVHNVVVFWVMERRRKSSWTWSKSVVMPGGLDTIKNVMYHTTEVTNCDHAYRLGEFNVVKVCYM